MSHLYIDPSLESFLSIMCFFAFEFAFILLVYGNAHLNEKNAFIFLFFYALLSLLLYFSTLDIPEIDFSKSVHRVLALPLFMVLLYKLADRVIVKKYGRHLIFQYKNNRDDLQSSIEKLIQFGFGLATVIFWFLLQSLE